MRAVALCLLCAAPFVPAQSVSRSRIATGFNAIQVSDLKADLRFLASDELEGRLSLARGSEVAIQWIVSEFEKAGLKPAGGGSFLQPVPLIEYRTDPKESGLTIRKGSKEQTYRSPDASGSFPNDITATGSIVFAGFGITAPELNYDDYAGIDARGKIVLIFDHEPQEDDPRSVFNGTGATKYASAYFKALNAQKHGAVGVLVAGEPNRKHPSNQERLARIRSSTLRSRIPNQAIEHSDIRIPLLSVSDQIANDLLDGRAKELQAQIDGALKPASREIPNAGAEIRNVLAERRRATTYNVIGMIPGSDPALQGESVIFAAHYDHDGPAPNGIYHGADDDGSGTVGVIELARAFAKNDVKPKRSLLFVIFAAEERGLLGSYYYVAHPLRPLETTRAVINFDMIGRDESPSEQTKGLIEIAPDTSNEVNIIGAHYSPAYRELVERANEMVGLHLNSKWDREPSLNIFFRSDHYPFVMHNVPALWWFTGFHPDYHQVTDTADKIDYTKMEKILRLAYVTGFEVGDAPNPPSFKQ
jgi:Peptidase family M28/PA domain